jgi:hypothetical protein
MQSSIAFFSFYLVMPLGEIVVLSRILLLPTTIFLAGCAIRPLPQDVSGVSTPVIVKQVRCETRQAVKDLALDWLTDDENLAIGRVDARARAIGFEFQRGQRPIQQFDPKLFQGHVKDVVETFFDTGVAYTFDLEMTEENNLNTNKPAQTVYDLKSDIWHQGQSRPLAQERTYLHADRYVQRTSEAPRSLLQRCLDRT